MWRMRFSFLNSSPASFSAWLVSASSPSSSSRRSAVSRVASQQAAQVATTSWPGLCFSDSARLRADRVRRGSSPPPHQPIEAEQQFQSGMVLSWMSSSSHMASTEVR